MTDRLSVFISSKQSELEVERAVIADKIRSLSFLEPVLAQEWPPQRADIRQVFLDQVRRAPIYIGLFHQIYSEPTEAEYTEAVTNPHREILIYLKQSDAALIQAPLQQLIERVKARHVTWSFRNAGDLVPQLTDHLGAALSRMVMLLQKLGENAPSGRGGSILRTRWQRERAAILQIGLPEDRAAAMELARRIEEGRDAPQRG